MLPSIRQEEHHVLENSEFQLEAAKLVFMSTLFFSRSFSALPQVHSFHSASSALPEADLTPTLWVILL